jgi:hypothetical protein
MKRVFPQPQPVSEIEQRALEAREEYRKRHPIPVSPCVDQTKADVEVYYRTAPVGAVAVVRHTQGGLLHYIVTEIEDRDPKRGRVYIRNAGAFYMKSGANCFHPKGQTSLVVPTNAVLAWAKEHPRGELDVATIRYD